MKIKTKKSVPHIQLKYQNYNFQDPTASGTEGGEGGHFAFSPKVMMFLYYYYACLFEFNFDFSF